jgi:hypothetical protein
MRGAIIDMSMIPDTRWVSVHIVNIDEMNKGKTVIKKGIETIAREMKLPDYVAPNYSEATLIVSPEEFQKLNLKLGDIVEIEVKKIE